MLLKFYAFTLFPVLCLATGVRWHRERNLDSIGLANSPARNSAAIGSTKSRKRSKPLRQRTDTNIYHLPLHAVPRAQGVHPKELYKRHLRRSQNRHLNLISIKRGDMPLGTALAPEIAKSVQTSVESTVNASGAAAAAVDAKAALEDTVTAPNIAPARNSLGVNIEANDVGYFATVNIGSQNQQFNILMDSGSGDFWVPSTSCTACGHHRALGAANSATFQVSHVPFNVTYGTGQVSGTIIKDDINIAGIKLTGHIFGVTTDETSDFSDSTIPFDGLMGLAQSALSQQGVLTPIESMKAAGLVDLAQMGFALGRVSDATNIGQVTFGGVDTSKFTGSLTMFDNVSKEGFWEGALDEVDVDGTDLNLKGRTAILDTGTTLIIAPSNDASAIHAAVPGSKFDQTNGFTVPCNTTSTVKLSFGGVKFSMDPTDLAFLPIDLNNPNGDCSSGIQSGQIGGATEWLVGDAFLKNVYLTTIVDTNQIGLAPIKSG